MNKESLKEKVIEAFQDSFTRDDGLLDIGKYDEKLVLNFIIQAMEEAYEEGKKQNIENNTLTVEIPKGYKTLDTRELSEGDKHWIEIDLIEDSEMCKIRQPHTGFDCKCNKSSIEAIQETMKEFSAYIKKELEKKELGKPKVPEIGVVNGSMGEWCHCGAWKQYGFFDNHLCPGYNTGYKITC